MRGSTPATSTLWVPGDVPEALEDLGIRIDKVVNNEAWALCPSKEHDNVHPDKWSVNLDSGKHSCFSCGFSGSFARIVMEVTGYDYSDSVQWIRTRGGLEWLRGAVASALDRFQQEELLVPVRSWNESRLALFTDAPAEARGARGVSSGSLDHYGIRWDPDNDFWILPIRDPETCKLWGYQEKGKGHFRNKPYGVKKSLTLFGIDCYDEDTVIVQESPLDCPRIHTAGIGGGVSTFGVRISDEQYELLFDMATTVIFALDNDDAGIKQSLDIQRRFMRSGRDIRFLDYSHIPTAKDLGTQGVSDSDIRTAVQNATSIVRYSP